MTKCLSGKEVETPNKEWNLGKIHVKQYEHARTLMTKRNSLEVIAEILSVCEQPQNKTRVMYRTSLSWQMLQKYLSQLQSAGLLEIHRSSTKYVTTQKGLKFEEKWSELVELLYS
ncbi:MAG: winged helix-turn-helix domain-containing protein [Candidatus Bathyarchaeota archaeon]|nr:winged helix-turn-helix domain-containing protein [Candidatus Bathyarchaeota archaeon]